MPLLRPFSLSNNNPTLFAFSIDSRNKSIPRTDEQAALVSAGENTISDIMSDNEWNEMDSDSLLHYPDLSSQLSFDCPPTDIDRQWNDTNETANTSSDRHEVNKGKPDARRN
jgi:hypothetical protein